MFEPISFDNYDIPRASDVAAFWDPFTQQGDPCLSPEPSEVVLLGVAKWFSRTVAQRVYRHSRSHRCGQELVAIDLVMFLLTEGYEPEHCSLEVYFSHFPSFSKLCMDDLVAQALDLGKTLSSFDIKYATIWDRESLEHFEKEVSGSGVHVGALNSQDWGLLRTIEREWVVR